MFNVGDITSEPKATAWRASKFVAFFMSACSCNLPLKKEVRKLRVPRKLPESRRESRGKAELPEIEKTAREVQAAITVTIFSAEGFTFLQGKSYFAWIHRAIMS